MFASDEFASQALRHKRDGHLRHHRNINNMEGQQRFRLEYCLQGLDNTSSFCEQHDVPHGTVRLTTILRQPQTKRLRGNIKEAVRRLDCVWSVLTDYRGREQATSAQLIHFLKRVHGDYKDRHYSMATKEATGTKDILAGRRAATDRGCIARQIRRRTISQRILINFLHKYGMARSGIYSDVPKECKHQT